MKLRQRISSALNTQLNHLGYALVRIDGERCPTMFTNHLGVRFAYEDVLITDGYAPWAIDEVFIKIWERIRDNTLVDIYRAFELYQLVGETRGIPGDVLEVGVWRGGTGAILAAAASRWRPGSTVWLCDTFAGVVKTGRHDTSYVGGEHADAEKKDVEGLVSALNLRNVTILKGVFPDETGAQLDDRKISFCHVDVDAYQSALDVARWVGRRMDPGGIIVFDDYGFSTCKGVTRCVEELRDSGEWMYFHNLNKHAVLIRR